MIKQVTVRRDENEHVVNYGYGRKEKRLKCTCEVRSYLQDEFLQSVLMPYEVMQQTIH